MRARAAMGPSSPVTVAIRPEDVAFAPGAGAGTEATVEEATFLGTLAEHVLAVPGEGPAAPLRLRARTLGRGFTPIGTAVRVAIDGSRCVLLE